MKYFFSFFFLLLLSNVYAQRVKPSLHLIKGETYYMTSTGTSAITQNIRGRENKVNLKLLYTMAFKVTGITDTVYSMEVKYQLIDMNIRIADTTIDMNSMQKGPDGNKPVKPDTPSLMLAAMVNRPFNISLSATGRILSVKNLDKILVDAVNDFPQLDAVKRENVKNQFVQSFGENAFKGSLETGTAIFPSMVAKNDKWTVNTTLSAPAKANVKTVYQLVDITGDLLQVHGDGSITSDEDTKPGEISGMPMKYTINGAVITDVKIDKKTGWIIQSTLKQLIEGKIEILDNPKAPGGMSIPIMFNTNISITNKPESPIN
jgi:hypothetical protein